MHLFSRFWSLWSGRRRGRLLDDGVVGPATCYPGRTGGYAENAIHTPPRQPAEPADPPDGAE